MEDFVAREMKLPLEVLAQHLTLIRVVTHWEEAVLLLEEHLTMA